MAYKGVIKQSRTIDLAAISQIVDTTLPIFLLYSPEQLGITVPIYMGIRLLFNGLAVYLRYKTTGEIGGK